jgi:hypothetical protein
MHIGFFYEYFKNLNRFLSLLNFGYPPNCNFERIQPLRYIAFTIINSDFPTPKPQNHILSVTEVRIGAEAVLN